MSKSVHADGFWKVRTSFRLDFPVTPGTKEEVMDGAMERFNFKCLIFVLCIVDKEKKKKQEQQAQAQAAAAAAAAAEIQEYKDQCEYDVIQPFITSQLEISLSLSLGSYSRITGKFRAGW